MKNLMEFTNFLPISNIITIVFEMLVNEIFFAKIQDLDIQTKVLVSQKVFDKNKSFNKYFLDF